MVNRVSNTQREGRSVEAKACYGEGEMVTHAVVTLPGQFASRTHEHDGIRVGTHTGRSRSVQLGSPDTAVRPLWRTALGLASGRQGHRDLRIHDSPPCRRRVGASQVCLATSCASVTNNLQERPSCEFMAFGLSVIRDCEWAGDREKTQGRAGRAGIDIP